MNSMNSMNASIANATTPTEERAQSERRVVSAERREERGIEERRLVERRGMLASMADAMEDILRHEVRSGVYRVADAHRPTDES